MRILTNGVDRLVLWLRRNTPAEYSSSTMGALDRLQTEGPLRVSELARRESMTQPGVTVLVNRLCEAGLAEKAPDPSDGRASLVCITDDGRQALARRYEARAALLRERIATLDPDDVLALAAALPAIERLTPALADAGGTDLRSKGTTR